MIDDVKEINNDHSNDGDAAEDDDVDHDGDGDDGDNKYEKYSNKGVNNGKLLSYMTVNVLVVLIGLFRWCSIVPLI